MAVNSQQACAVFLPNAKSQTVMSFVWEYLDQRYIQMTWN